jgi:hypothetical protein
MKTIRLPKEEENKTKKLTCSEKLKKQKEDLNWLEELMFAISHKLRQPVAHILGLSGLFNTTSGPPSQLNKIAGYMKQSTLKLDNQIRELSSLIYKKITQLKTPAPPKK